MNNSLDLTYEGSHTHMNNNNFTYNEHNVGHPVTVSYQQPSWTEEDNLKKLSVEVQIEVLRARRPVYNVEYSDYLKYST